MEFCILVKSIVFHLVDIVRPQATMQAQQEEATAQYALFQADASNSGTNDANQQQQTNKPTKNVPSYYTMLQSQNFFFEYYVLITVLVFLGLCPLSRIYYRFSSTSRICALALCSVYIFYSVFCLLCAFHPLAGMIVFFVYRLIEPVPHACMFERTYILCSHLHSTRYLRMERNDIFTIIANYCWNFAYHDTLWLLCICIQVCVFANCL